MEQFSENELIFASKLYAEQLSEAVSEEAYYQTLGRMCKAGTLCRIAKGTYYRPKTSKYGVVPPSQNEIIAAFTEHDRGVVVGYSLYNRLKLTTQIPRKVEVLSSQIEQQTKTIGNVRVKFCDLVYNSESKDMIRLLEVLQNFSGIQDMNYRQFLSVCQNRVSKYDDNVFEQVNQQLRYQKRTISFLRMILDHHGIKNGLSKHLSALSEYRHPTIEEIIRKAHNKG
jgi:hypothetical protein